MLKASNSGLIIKPSELEGFILNEYGIRSNIIMMEGNPMIKVYNHFSLFEIIKKIRRNFDFTVHHKLKKNEYIIILKNKYGN